MSTYVKFCKCILLMLIISVAFCWPTTGIDRYVVKDNPAPVPDYTNWSEAAPDIQSAIDVSSAGDVIWVSNGVYDSGGLAGVRRVYINKTDLTIRSVNGPTATLIDGGGDRRCVIMVSNSWLIGFTLSNGNAGATSYGGGIYGAAANSNSFVSNCVIVGNLATNNRGGGARYVTMYNCTVYNNQAKYGGGIADSLVYNSIISNNTAMDSGGGVYAAQMFNCLVVNNSANYDGGGYADSAAMSTLPSYNCTIAHNWAGDQGGGAYYGKMYNGILYYNTAVTSGAERYGGQFTNCCLSTATAGDGNITNAPLFVDTNTANYRLSQNSPCINAGSNSPSLMVLYDLDGHSRIDPFCGRIDIGAYEYILKGAFIKVR